MTPITAVQRLQEIAESGGYGDTHTLTISLIGLALIDIFDEIHHDLRELRESVTAELEAISGELGLANLDREKVRTP